MPQNSFTDKKTIHDSCCKNALTLNQGYHNNLQCRNFLEFCTRHHRQIVLHHSPHNKTRQDRDLFSHQPAALAALRSGIPLKFHVVMNL